MKIALTYKLLTRLLEEPAADLAVYKEVVDFILLY
jgi:hypothetical protein